MLTHRIALAALMLGASCANAFAVSDEIQVYTGEIMPMGEWGLTWHNNYAVNGTTTADFPRGLIDNHTYASVTEWAYGVTPWFEAGLYLPLYSHSGAQGWTYNGFKLRALFVQPDNGHKDFYYGVNFEFSWNETQWDSQVNTGEIRPIIGFRFGENNRFSFTFNPIVDNNYKGGIGGLEFVPSTRLDYRLDEHWTIAAEEYDDFGQLRGFLPWRSQTHQVWAVADYDGDPISVEAGIGAGLTPGTDNLAFKVSFMSDLTGEHGLLSRWTR